MINHNPHNLKPGDLVVLDAKYAEPSFVKILSMTQHKLYSEVSSGNSKWNVMTCRLTPIDNTCNKALLGGLEVTEAVIVEAILNSKEMVKTLPIPPSDTVVIMFDIYFGIGNVGKVYLTIHKEMELEKWKNPNLCTDDAIAYFIKQHPAYNPSALKAYYIGDLIRN